MKIKAFVVLIGWFSFNPSPVTAKGFRKPGLQKEDNDIKSALQQQNDLFEHFVAEPEVSSALVVTSNTSEKQDVDNAGTALVSSETDDRKSAQQQQDDLFEHFTAEPEVSSALVVTSNTSEKQDVDNAGTALVSSETDDHKSAPQQQDDLFEHFTAEVSSAMVVSNTSEKQDVDNALVVSSTGGVCDDEKANLSMVFGLIGATAAIAALVVATGGIGAIYVAVLGAAGSIGGAAVNYMECPSGFEQDWNRIQQVAQQVYNTNKLKELKTEVTAAFSSVTNTLFFQLRSEDINHYIDRFDAIRRRLTNKDLDMACAELMLMVTSFLTNLYFMAIAKAHVADSKKQGDPNIAVVNCEGLGASLKELIDETHQYMQSLSWRYVRRDFINHPSTDCTITYKVEGGCIPLGEIRWSDCYLITKTCFSDYSGKRLTFKKEWESCAACNSRTPRQYVTMDELVDTEYKPKYEEWYRSIKPKWDAFEKLHEKVKSLDTYFFLKICAKYEKPLCFPHFFSDKQLGTGCCLATDQEEYDKYRCGNFEGICYIDDPDKPPLPPKCKTGYECKSLEDIFSGMTIYKKKEITDYTGWDLNDDRNVCYKAGEPLPEYNDEDLPDNYKKEGYACDDSTECREDLCCEKRSKKCEKIDDVAKDSGKMCMRSSAGDNGGGYLCNVDSDCENPDHCCETTVDVNNPRCWLWKDYPNRKCIPDKLVADDGDTCYSTADCKGGFCCDKTTKTCKDYETDDDDCMADPQLGDRSGGIPCGGDSSDCKNDNCCVDEENNHKCWGIEGLGGVSRCAPDPLRGGYSGMGCYDSSDCKDGSCCADKGGCWGIEGVWHRNGDMCLRDPTGGGLGGIYLCAFDSDCASGKCENGVCGKGNGHTGAPCNDSSDCADNNCCYETGGCWSIGGLNGNFCLRDPDGGGKDGSYKCDSNSDCESGNCKVGYCGGGRSGAACNDSSDCADGSCCADKGDCWGIEGVLRNGDMCLRDPDGGGKDGSYRCDSNSDCESGNCKVGYCGGGHSGATCDDSSDCADNNCCYETGGCWSIQGLNGRKCLRDPDGGGKDGFYKCNSNSDCEWDYCKGGICTYVARCFYDSDCASGLCLDNKCEDSGPWSHDESPKDEPLSNPKEPSPSSVVGTTEAPCCGNGENLISKILHAKSLEGGEHTMGLKTVIQKVLM